MKSEKETTTEKKAALGTDSSLHGQKGGGDRGKCKRGVKRLQHKYMKKK